MDQFIASLPKPILALGAILIGFVLIVAYDPPRTACDVQMEHFREAQESFLYSRQAEGVQASAVVKQMFDMCQANNSPGGCFEFFLRLKKLAADLDNIPKKCGEAATQEEQIQVWLWKSMKLMAQIAWGSRAPASFHRKHSWFDSSDVALFCDLKRNAIKLYGSEAFEGWREGVMQGLPEADRLIREQLWQKSIFSTSCEAFR